MLGWGRRPHPSETRPPALRWEEREDDILFLRLRFRLATKRVIQKLNKNQCFTNIFLDGSGGSATLCRGFCDPTAGGSATLFRGFCDPIAYPSEQHSGLVVARLGYCVPPQVSALAGAGYAPHMNQVVKDLVFKMLPVYLTCLRQVLE